MRDIQTPEAQFPTIQPKIVLRLYQLLKDTHEIFTAHELPYWIDAGTLLGAVRHNGLIPWDDDLDICIDKAHIHKITSLISEFKKLGYGFAEFKAGYKFYALDGSSLGRAPWLFPFIDIFPMRLYDQKYTYDRAYDEWIPKYRRGNEYVYIQSDELFPLKKYKFGELSVYGPNDPVPYLNALYGSDWLDYAYRDYEHSTQAKIIPVKVRLTEPQRLPAAPTGPLEDRVDSAPAKAELSDSANRVESAVIVAAGVGSRLSPLTNHTHKSLIRINGKPIIESIIDSLLDSQINTIYVVVGHLKESFSYLTEKYKDRVTLIENPDYKIKNNISSLYAARHVLANSYILDGDLFIKKNPFVRDLNRSTYFVIYRPGKTREWGINFEIMSGEVEHVAIGSEDQYVLSGISYFTREDSAKLVRLLEKAYPDPKYANFYWDDLVRLNLHKFDMYIRNLPIEDLIEIDTLDELRALSPESVVD